MPGAAWRCAGDGGCVPSLRVCVCLSSVPASGGQHVLASGEVVMGVLFSSVSRADGGEVEGNGGGDVS